MEADQKAETDYSPPYSEDGVDLTLIRWMLSLTPAERLQVLQRHVNAILAIRKLNPDSDFRCAVVSLARGGDK
jgi:hypothetical protein